MTKRYFDVIVIGGGHAGAEAALAAARVGAQTLLLTQNTETLGQMSCNPAIGGIGKGHLVKEIDALGGMMALAADESGIQFRRLNASRGPAVRATRTQSDRILYKAAVRRRLTAADNLLILQHSIDDLLVHGGQIRGVSTTEGTTFHATSVALCVGTFLAGVIHIGDKQSTGGRVGCPSATALAARLRELNLPVGRLKTGTPPRLDGRSIDFSNLEAQPGMNRNRFFRSWAMLRCIRRNCRVISPAQRRRHMMSSAPLFINLPFLAAPLSVKDRVIALLLRIK